jgi:hypothetical protein
MADVKNGYIGPSGELQPNALFLLRFGPVQFQATADLTCLHPHNGIIARNIIIVAPENFDSDQPFLDDRLISKKLLFDNVTEKLLAPFTGPEVSTADNSL